MIFLKKIKFSQYDSYYERREKLVIQRFWRKMSRGKLLKDLSLRVPQKMWKFYPLSSHLNGSALLKIATVLKFVKWL